VSALRGRVAALVMTALLVLYLLLVVQYSFVLMGTGTTIGVAMGVALLVIPLIGAWVLFRELRFVISAERLVARMAAAGELPVDELPRLPSGRVDPAAADLEFPTYQAEVENDPESWRAWIRLGLAYDASGDRSRARWATREALRLERASRAASAG